MRATTTTTGRAVFGRVAVLGLATMAGFGLLPAAASGAAAQPTPAKIQNFSFSPNPLTIPVGTTVQWTNLDGVTHTVTSDDGSSFNSGDVSPNTTFSHTFDQAGVTIAYHCNIHQSMHGTITVEGTAPTTAPASTTTTAAPTTTTTVRVTTTTAPAPTTTAPSPTTTAPPRSTTTRPAAPSTTRATAATTTTTRPAVTTTQPRDTASQTPGTTAAPAAAEPSTVPAGAAPPAQVASGAIGDTGGAGHHGGGDGPLAGLAVAGALGLSGAGWWAFRRHQGRRSGAR